VPTCGHDPLCDEARAYAHRLKHEGAPGAALHLSDRTHGMVTMGGVIGAAAGVLATGTAIRQAWRSPSGSLTTGA
jgi:acetyl esterase